MRQSPALVVFTQQVDTLLDEKTRTRSADAEHRAGPDDPSHHFDLPVMDPTIQDHRSTNSRGSDATEPVGVEMNGVEEAPRQADFEGIDFSRPTPILPTSVP